VSAAENTSDLRTPTSDPSQDGFAVVNLSRLAARQTVFRTIKK